MLYLQFGSFSLLSMMDHGTQFAGTEAGVFSATEQNVIFALLMFGLGILVGLWAVPHPGRHWGIAQRQRQRR